MKYTYHCIDCQKPVTIEWEKRNKRFKHENCDNPETFFDVPSPDEDQNAFVDQHDPPEEMRDAVISEKGTNCCVEWCTNDYDDLDHRVAWDNDPNGTSVANLFPMCEPHNSSKSTKDYQEWLEEIEDDPDLGRAAFE